jgi:hypothetical protein
MRRATIIVEIDPEGHATVSVDGQPGPGCYALTRDLEAALGRTVRDERTREYFQRAEAAEPLRARS